MNDFKKRVKIVEMPEDQILQLLNWRQYNYLTLPVIDCDELPEGAQVVAVHDNPSRRCFDLLVYHESFPEVPIGTVPPIINGPVAMLKTVKLREVAKDIYEGFSYKGI